MTDEQREAIEIAIKALEKLGWSLRIPVLSALLSASKPAAPIGDLPPLPKPCQKGWIYDSAQMRAYALEAIAATPAAPAQSAEPVVAWLTDDDRVISDAQKRRALAEGGACASTVAPYSIALGRIAATQQPAQAGEAKYDPRDPGNWRDGDDAMGAAVAQDERAAIRRAALKDAENIARLFDLGTPDGHAIADDIRKLADAEVRALSHTKEES